MHTPHTNCLQTEQGRELATARDLTCLVNILILDSDFPNVSLHWGPVRMLYVAGSDKHLVSRYYPTVLAMLLDASLLSKLF